MFVQKYRKVLESQLSSRECKEAFEGLKSEYSIFDLYPTVEFLCHLFKPKGNYAHKDEIMSILITELRRNRAIFPLIQIIFWNSLSRLHYQRQFRVAEPKELFSTIQDVFFQSLMDYNLEQLPKKVDINIFFNTKKGIIKWEKKNLCDKEKAKRLIEDYSKDGLSPSDLCKSKVYPEQMEDFLLDKVYRGIITDTQYDLILETLVYKRMNQREWAEQKGMSYHTVRNLRYRAEVAIRGYEEKRRKEEEISKFF